MSSLLRGESDNYKLDLYIQQTLNFDTTLNDDISYDIQENDNSELTIYRNYNNVSIDKLTIGDTNTTIKNNLIIRDNLSVSGDTSFTGDLNINNLTTNTYVKTEELRIRDSIITSNVDLNITQTIIDYSTYNPYGSINATSVSVLNPKEYQNLTKLNVAYISDLNYGDIIILLYLRDFHIVIFMIIHIQKEF